MRVYLIDRYDVQVFQNDQRLKVFSENGREYVEPQMDADGTAQLRFVRTHELCAPLWWLSALIFWILGITGLFTPRYSTFYYSLDCTVRVSSDYNGVQLKFCKQYKNNKYNNVTEVCVVGDGRAQIVNGSYQFDEKAAKRRKTYKLLSWLMRIVVIVVVVIVVIYRIVEGG